MTSTVTVTDPVAAFAADVRAGLTRPGQKELPSRYLYDTLGSKLFEAICELPEYGLTRADERILQSFAHEISRRISGDVIVCELGSGNGRKTRFLLEALSRRQRIENLLPGGNFSLQALAICERELRDIESVGIVGLEQGVSRRPPRSLLASEARGSECWFLSFWQHDWEFQSALRSQLPERSPGDSSRRRPAAAGNGISTSRWIGC